MYCVKWNRRIRYNTDLLAIHDEAFLSHSVGAACSDLMANHMISDVGRIFIETSSHIGNHCWPGPLGLWNKRNCCGLVEVLLLSSRFLFPCLPQKFTRTAEYLPGTLWPTRLQDWHLNLWKVWKATQQRSPWAVPLTTAHARALTNEPRLPPQCVHIPTKGGRTTPLLEI